MKFALNRLIFIIALFLSSGAAILAGPPTDAVEFGKFTDDWFSKNLKEQKLPGLVFIAVKDGGVFYKKGYGHANIKANIPADPDTTAFFTASVSKLITATAVMQLAERGKLKLDADINSYLNKPRDLTIKYPFQNQKPVTAINLLTHTAGFDEKISGLAELNPDEVLPLLDYLKVFQPPIIFAPGEITSYSNYGFSLAGYLVERISGKKFNEYVKTNILLPLEMNQSAFGPLYPPDIKKIMARGYIAGGEESNVIFEEFDPLYLNANPAGGFVTTARDMAKFMIAHLNRGGAILSPETATLSHKTHFRRHPILPGFAAGFIEIHRGRLRALAHDGDLPGYGARLLLLPEHNFGFYMVYNAGGNQIRREYTEALLARYFKNDIAVRTPGPKSNAKPDLKSAENKDIPSPAGWYRATRYPHNTIGKVTSLAFQAHILRNEKGKLILNLPAMPDIGEPELERVNSTELLATGDEGRKAAKNSLVYRRSDGKGYLVFQTDERGNIKEISLSILDIPMVLEKISFWESMPVQVAGFAYFTVLFGLCFIIVIITALIKLFRRKTTAPPWLKTQRILYGTALINFTFVIGFALVNALQMAIMRSPGFSLYLVFSLPLITTALLPYLWVKMTELWKSKNISGFRHFWARLLLISLTLYPLFLYSWNFLGYNF